MKTNSILRLHHRNYYYVPYLPWLDGLKAFALMAIMMNHLVEEFGSGPWFTNPSNNWPDFATRIRNIFPHDYTSPIISIFQFFGWLGDSGPGVFILVSGIGLTWAALHRPPEEMKIFEFYRRRLISIFPLYIAMHFIILAGSLSIPNNKLSLANPKTLLSMLGLRFTDSLFFYISPSWWFVWLIIQLYLIFPFLYQLLKNVKIRWFIVITFGFTFISRLYGIIFSKSLYYWMTGIFFGTRLAEFSIGMVIALLLFQSNKKENEILITNRIVIFSFLIYVLGLICSFTLPGSIVSNLLVTLGMAGLFYTLWQKFIIKVQILKKFMVWVGIESYAIYLLHQPILKWTAVIHNNKWHLIAAILTLLLSFPTGYFINKIVKGLLSIRQRFYGKELDGKFALISILIGAAALIFIDPHSWSPWKREIFLLSMGVFLFYSFFLEYYASNKERWSRRFLRWMLLFAVFLQLFGFPLRLGILTMFGALILATFALFVYKFCRMRFLAWLIAVGIITVIGTSFEAALRYYAPLEIGKWGELPALEIHPTRIYALKPNQVTRLKYNNYDYIVSTNSFGLASPEIKPERPTLDTFRVLIIGDAFSMPEGVNYECSYPALLEEKLKKTLKPRVVQVINGGVTGYGPVEQYSQLKELMPLFTPDVVVYQFFINEFSDVAITPDEKLKNIGLKESKESKYLNIIKHSQVLGRLNLLKTSFKEKITGIPAKWRYSKSLLNYYRINEDKIYTEENINKVYYYLEEMKKICEKFRSKFIIFFVPGAVAVSKPSDIDYFPWDQNLLNKELYDLERPLRILREISDQLKIPMIDLTQDLKKHPNQPVYFQKSWHWNKEGHRIVADIIHKNLIIGQSQEPRL